MPEPLRRSLALARLTAVEGVRGAFLPVAALALAALVLLLPRLVVFGFGEEARLIRELALATLRLGALVTALALATLVARDRERGALATFLARPLGGAGYAAGRFLGGLALLAVLLSMLSVARAPALKGDAEPLLTALIGAYRTLLEGAVISAWAVLLGSLLRPGAAAVATFAAFAAGHLHAHARAALTDAGPVGLLAAKVYAALVADLSAIGAPQAGAPDPGIGVASALASAGAVTYLSLAVAGAAWRELPSSGERA